MMMLASSRAISTKALQHVLSSSRAVHATHLIAPASVPSHNVHLNHQHLHQTKHASSVPTRQFSSNVNHAQPSIKLYQYHICPFCNITKSAMQYAKLDYEAVEVNPLTKAELKPWSDYKKVPIAIINNQQINGSKDILNSIFNSPYVQEGLAKQWSNNNNNTTKEVMTIQQFKESDTSKKWYRFASDDLGAVLYPNICGTIGDSFHAFDYVKNVDSFSPLQKLSIQYVGSLAMYFAASKVKSKRNITDEKAALQSALDKFEEEGLQNGALPFSSGNPTTPDLGDLAVFGVLYAIRDMNAHKDAVQNRGGVVKDWYERMEKIVVREQ
ncbi:hypothetical protein ACHAWO_001731 [Cyclotella atomus]|uniref:GST N-terminal domain-containing protein n=1 Tax=Cyclotella atomus TaxID=382360 RepID=A0ABD3N6J5_9STRA